MTVDDDFTLENVPVGWIEAGDQVAILEHRQTVVCRVQEVKRKHAPPDPMTYVLHCEQLDGKVRDLSFESGEHVDKIVRV
jgi:hypothetical protein